MERTFKVEYLCGECCETYPTSTQAQGCCGDISQSVFICNVCEDEFDIRPVSTDGLKDCCAKMVIPPKPVDIPPVKVEVNYPKREAKRPTKIRSKEIMPDIDKPKLEKWHRSYVPDSGKKLHITAGFDDAGKVEIKNVEVQKQPDPNCPECGLAQKFGKVENCRCMK